jgi:hypothetical protein
MHVFATSTAEQVLEMGKAAAFVEVEAEAAKSGQRERPGRRRTS